MAPPITYTAGGAQYIAISVGTGGGHFLLAGAVAEHSGKQRNISRILAFRLDGKDELPPRPVFDQGPLAPPPAIASAADVVAGKVLFHKYCSVCHGGAAHSGGVIPDLRHSATLGNDGWFDVVLGGVLKDRGMVSFSSALDHKQVEAIRAYVIARAREDAQK
jgi:alcohol dehydrogenase (cytochrome c)/quinohemoprotein ethanol dehydrogenase